ncbi:rhodanese-like domain-containing protein [Streptococcus suis]|uniref:rhodanese-like domain-containing protein n=1 Tax=Streptococcus suis TaxID=1307 RepID=UPI0010A7C00E|nr:rhodanese-like domain-containing protein [Streptococcus suis]QCE38655.1 hypothetical protein E8M06_04965 [Streptococcus suis]
MLENQEQTLTLSAAELLDLMQTESVQLLDVRDPEEYSYLTKIKNSDMIVL